MLASLRSRFTRVAEKFTGGAQRPGEPPIVRAPLPFVGHALAIGRDMTALLQACQREHGDVFTLLVAGQRMTFILDPLSFPLVLKAQDNLTFAEIGEQIGARAFGYHSLGPGAATDALHAAYGDHLKNAALPPLTERMEDRLRAALAQFTGDEWREVGLFEFSGRCIFTAGLETLFGVGVVDEGAYEDFHRHDKWFPLMAAGVPLALLPGAVAARARMTRRIDPQRPDASAFIRVRDELLNRLTTRHNRLHMQFGIVWASQANTLPAAFWSLAQVLHDERARAAVTAEVTEHGIVDLKKLPKLASAVSEALRLCTESLTIRLVHRDCTLALANDRKISLRAGDRVALCPQITHCDPEVFAGPTEYRYDRFLADGGPKQFFKRGQKVPIPLMPYGGGVSMCPGRYLANNEVMQFVALALTLLEFEGIAAELPAVDKSRAGLGALSPIRDVRCRVRRRPTA